MNKKTEAAVTETIRCLYEENQRKLEETEKRLDELTILYEMTKISHSSLGLDQMLKEIMKSLYHFFEFDAMVLLLLDENTGRFFLHPSSIGFSAEEVENLDLCIGRGLTGWAAERGESLLVNDVREDSRYLSGRDAILSEMVAPLTLKVGEKMIGVIDAQSRTANTFSKDHLLLFEIAGQHLATIIDNVRSEERYRAVVENALDGVLVMGEGYQLTYINERLAELLGYLREELIGKDFMDFLDEESRRLMGERLIQGQRGEEVPSRYELKVLRKDGEVRHVEVSSTMINGSEGAISKIAFLKDVTEKRKMEEQLLQAEKLRAVGEMASGVAHDFNNALAIILGNTQLLLYGVKDEETREALKTIEKVAKDSAHTVSRLQEFTKSKTTQKLFKMDINAILKDAMEITKPKWKDGAQGMGIHIKMVPHFGKVPHAAGNVSELREVIINMIFNAVEAMPKGGRIEIRTFRKKEKVYIEISDTGMGMTDEVRQKVFEPFFTTKPYSNTGLGLSMAYGIIQRFGGKIEVQSEQEKGTVFTISLPIGKEGKEETDHFPILKKGREARVLVIDDEENVRNVLMRSLSQVNHQVMTAPNGEEGLKLFREKKFDIVLTDLGMPNMSGWEVCKAIKEMSPNTPVGMITGWGMEIDSSKKMESRIDFVISKPFDLNQILNQVSETLGPD